MIVGGNVHPKNIIWLYEEAGEQLATFIVTMIVRGGAPSIDDYSWNQASCNSLIVRLLLRISSQRVIYLIIVICFVFVLDTHLRRPMLKWIPKFSQMSRTRTHKVNDNPWWWTMYHYIALTKRLYTWRMQWAYSYPIYSEKISFIFGRIPVTHSVRWMTLY